MTELHYLTIAEAAAKLAARQLSPVELVQAALERIEAINPQVNAFITVTADLALSLSVPLLTVIFTAPEPLLEPYFGFLP